MVSNTVPPPSRIIREGVGKVVYTWSKWFAWYPVKVHGQKVWCKFVYRRAIPKTYVTYDDWTKYEYGNIFDVLAND